jgi:hypothetical protein
MNFLGVLVDKAYVQVNNLPGGSEKLGNPDTLLGHVCSHQATLQEVTGLLETIGPDVLDCCQYLDIFGVSHGYVPQVKDIPLFMHPPKSASTLGIRSNFASEIKAAKDSETQGRGTQCRSLSGWSQEGPLSLLSSQDGALHIQQGC